MKWLAWNVSRLPPGEGWGRETTDISGYEMAWPSSGQFGLEEAVTINTDTTMSMPVYV